MRSFQEVWAQKVREGYQYGPDSLEQVKFGWDLAMQQIERLQKERDRYKFGWDLAMQQIERLQKERDRYNEALKEIREQFELLGWD